MKHRDSDSKQPELEMFRGTPEAAPASTSSTQNPGANQIVSSDAALPQTLFVVPIQSNPVFPGMFAPLVLNKPQLIETLEQAMQGRGLLGLVLAHGEDGRHYETGTVVRVLRKLNTTDGGVTVLVHSLKRFRIHKMLRTEPYKLAQVDYIDDIIEKNIELDALTRSVISQVKSLSDSNPFFTEEMKLAMLNAPNAGVLSDLVAFALGLKREDAQDFLETQNVQKRFEKLLVFLKSEQEVADVQKRINDDVNDRMQKMQREFFLREQLKTIRQELGAIEGGGEAVSLVDKYREKLSKVVLSDDAKSAAKEEIAKLDSTPESSPEYNITRNYLDFLFALPWSERTSDNLDLRNAKKVLDEDHFGIPKVKGRILEFLAVRKLNPKARTSILCLVGPPGVGKTSLGKSIARSMGRNFFRFSLGGMRDEAEIKGHRRTYVGAMPGKVLNAMKRVSSKNPVILLDEIDKLSSGLQGDPASALLEVLDPEQNKGFLDHYLDVPYDLSDVLFIVTANTTATIPAPLLDRMEVIELSGYTLEEKQKIAREYVIPHEIENSGLQNVRVTFTADALKKIMLEYCREPGMRSTQQTIARIAHKIAAKVVLNAKTKKVTVRGKDLYEYLGPERFDNEVNRRMGQPGIVVGLAWTPMGGQILFIEAGEVPSRQGNFKVTGQLGEVMNESVSIAYSLVKKRTRKQSAAQKFFDQNDIHVHVPAGATPKDGPSAGVTMATALLSLVTGRKVKSGVAMTGELSLAGKVLPVGGIKEKVLAAKRAGITSVILPRQNQKDLKEMDRESLKGMSFVFADKIDEVFDAALV